MGPGHDAIAPSVTGGQSPPGNDEIELTLLGPGYGESIVLHVGNGVWVLVDSCLATDKKPRALAYLESIGVMPAQAVRLIVATHWHDDHIRGMARLVEVCGRADFCCAGVLCQKEFLAAVHALEGRHLSAAGSGLREMHGVFSRLRQGHVPLKQAVANRPIFSRKACTIWALSPSDGAFLKFLKSIGGLLPREGEAKTRVPSLSPNEAAVALWVEIGDIRLLLGSDVEKGAWAEILNSSERPTNKASAFKVPHHGSMSAHEPVVWKEMLDADPLAVLTPWRRCGRSLPTQRDAQRILSHTPNAYSTARTSSSTSRRSTAVERTIRESGVKLRRLVLSPGALRLRRQVASRAGWEVEMFGPACHLSELAR